MKRLFLVLTLLTACFTASYAQDAKTVLDKCAASINAKTGVQADFIMNRHFGPICQIMMK